MASDRNDNYQIVTDQIILALENVQSGKWEKPWKTGARPTSVSSGKAYRGINNILLKMQQLFGGYEFPLWLTFEQAKKLGGSVKKGEKSTTVVFWKFIKTTKEDSSTGEEKEHTFPMLRTFRVFNIDQCENLDRDKIVAKFIEDNERRDFNPIAHCEEFVENINATITYQNIDIACYVPGLDVISMPLRESFKSEEGFYSTLLHELGHWTMHKDRCDRTNSNYAFEELVAEFTSAFVSSELGLETGLQHPAYIASWLSMLRNDNKLAMKAAQQAQKAADFLWSFQGNSVDSEDENNDEDCA